ncbi:hypothetical protein GXW82_12500 [Streptacidiphilus sp. 4-A2]|nr:hypothetical protein [Streptacidiphilus sp. 4-A2]
MSEPSVTPAGPTTPATPATPATAAAAAAADARPPATPRTPSPGALEEERRVLGLKPVIAPGTTATARTPTRCTTCGRARTTPRW